VNQLDGLRRYLEAATTLTQITRGRAEELVRDLVASGELERTRAQEWIEDLLKRSREASETLVSSISAEVERQLADRGLKNLDLDDLAQRVAGIIEHAGAVGRNVTVPRVWSRGPSEATAAAGSKPEKDGSKTKGKSASGKKKDGSEKSSSKQGKKSSESKKAHSKKSERAETHTSQPEKIQTATSQPEKIQLATSQPEKIQPDTSRPETTPIEEPLAQTEAVDHGIAT
jgi:polyhydroxyalkanoate synthesis regulator phasin